MGISLPEFQGRCKFYLKGNTLHGEVVVQLPDGSRKRITAAEDMTPAMRDIAEASPVGWGIPGVDLDDAVDAVKSTAKAVVKSDVTKKLYGAAKTLAANPKLQAAVAVTVPGGSAIAIGMKAATLIEKATLSKDPAAKAKIAAISSAAQSGNKTAQKAHAVLKTVYAQGKAKGAWSSSASVKAKAPAPSGKKKSAAPMAAAGLGLGALLLALL